MHGPAAKVTSKGQVTVPKSFVTPRAPGKAMSLVFQRVAGEIGRRQSDGLETITQIEEVTAPGPRYRWSATAAGLADDLILKGPPSRHWSR